MNKKQLDMIMYMLRHGAEIKQNRDKRTAILRDGTVVQHPAAWVKVVEATEKKFEDIPDIYRAAIRGGSPVKTSMELHLSVAKYYYWRNAIRGYALAAACQTGAVKVF